MLFWLLVREYMMFRRLAPLSRKAEGGTLNVVKRGRRGGFPTWDNAVKTLVLANTASSTRVSRDVHCDRNWRKGAAKVG